MNIQSFLIIFTLCSLNLFASIEDYFKIPLDKSGCHQMRNVDFIYTINLNERPEKFASCTNQLHPYGIFPYRFSAVNGWKLSFETLNDLGIKFEPWMIHGIWGTCYFPEDEGQPHHEVINVVGRNYYSHCMSRGAIGIVLSHLSILQDAYDSGYETIWIMEDDIQIIRNPHIISDLIDKLDSLAGKRGWDILFTDQDTKNQQGLYVPCLGYAMRPNFNPENAYRFAARLDVGEFRRIGARYGAYSMIIRRSGMKKILDFFKQYKVFLPYDMEIFFPSDLESYSVINDVVSTQPNAPSDNGGPNYRTFVIESK
jgi:GR25 family glycosyltransferase involved in LPS biosynthesis